MLQGAKVVSVNEESCIVSWITFIHFRSLTITNTVTSCCVTPTLHIDNMSTSYPVTPITRSSGSLLRHQGRMPSGARLAGRTGTSELYIARGGDMSLCISYAFIIWVESSQSIDSKSVWNWISLHSKYKPLFKSFWGVTWSNIPKNWSNYYQPSQSMKGTTPSTNDSCSASDQAVDAWPIKWLISYWITG